jgi:hypothetical protein
MLKLFFFPRLFDLRNEKLKLVYEKTFYKNFP